MKTRKLISCISYHSPDYLKRQFKVLTDMRVINYAGFIHHSAEESEKKDHNHIILQPNGSIDTDDMDARYLTELIGNAKDGSVEIPKNWRFSKFGDWFLYAIHDRAYLESKYPNDKPKKFSYQPSDIWWTDNDIAEDLINQIDRSSLCCPTFEKVREYAMAGIPLEVLLKSYSFKLSQVFSIRQVYQVFGNFETTHSNNTGRY